MAKFNNIFGAGSPLTRLYGTSALTPTWNHALAVALAECGCEVFPCSGGDGNGRPIRPLINDWGNDATADPSRVGEWWREHPNALPAMLLPHGRSTSPITSQLRQVVAIELSEAPGRHGGKALREAIGEDEFAALVRDFPTVRTREGRTVFTAVENDTLFNLGPHRSGLGGVRVHICCHDWVVAPLSRIYAPGTCCAEYDDLYRFVDEAGCILAPPAKELLALGRIVEGALPTASAVLTAALSGKSVIAAAGRASTIAQGLAPLAAPNTIPLAPQMPPPVLTANKRTPTGGTASVPLWGKTS